MLSDSKWNYSFLMRIINDYKFENFLFPGDRNKKLTITFEILRINTQCIEKYYSEVAEAFYLIRIMIFLFLDDINCFKCRKFLKKKNIWQSVFWKEYAYLRELFCSGKSGILSFGQFNTPFFYIRIIYGIEVFKNASFISVL